MSLSVQALQRYGKPLAHTALLLPFLWLLYGWYDVFYGSGRLLGFNPQEVSNRFSGDWAMRIILLSLAVTPFGLLIKSKKPILFRRLIGLWGFFYGLVHLASYIGLDMGFHWLEVGRDIVKRLYITVGMTAFVFLVPLAVTSTAKSVRRLGAKTWQRLHRLVYAIGLLVIVHFIMMRKGWQAEPLIYAFVLLFLLAFRLPFVKKMLKPSRRAATASKSPSLS